MGEPETQIAGVRAGTVLGETYQLTRLIGQGGMGAVWEATHLRLPGKRVAVKVLLANLAPGSEAWTRFKREAEIATRIGHANIVEVVDFNVMPSGTPYLVLELLAGQSLAARLEKGGAVPAAETAAIARQIGSALAAAHREGVVHRDLKPENVFLCPGDEDGPPRVKVLDFGISKITGSTTLQTQEQRILGTPQYMSPEQAKGENSAIDARTDVFALGAIVYEMLSGKPAFTGDNLAEVVFKVVYEAPKPLAELAPGTPPHMVAAVEKAMAKKPDERFADVPAMIAALTGRPLPTVDRMPGAGAAAGGVATAPTVASQDVPAAAAPAKRASSEAFAATVSSQDVPAPAPVSAPAKPAPATTTEDTRGRGGGGRGVTFAVVGALLVAAAGGGYVLATRGQGAPSAATSGGAAAPDASTAVAVTSTPDAAVIAEAPVPDAALPDAAPAVVTAKPPPPPAKARPDAGLPDEEPEAEEEGTAKQWLDQAQAAFKSGNYKEAIRLARRSQNERMTMRSWSIMTRAYCKLGDLGNAKAQLQHLGPLEKKRVIKFCSKAGVELK